MRRRTFLSSLPFGTLLAGSGPARAQTSLAHQPGSGNPVEMMLNGGTASLRLSVLSYQFPQITTGDYDANWLIVQGHVLIGDRSWTFRDPALLTVEVRLLADWLTALVRAEPVDLVCSFIEPNLQFERTSPTTIRVAFALESAPPWAKQGDSWTEHGFDVRIDGHLQMAAEQLRSQLKAFPPRGDWTSG